VYVDRIPIPIAETFRGRLKTTDHPTVWATRLRC
jgi:hypothetical protein